MTKLTTEIKRMLNAMAAADAGEFLTLSQKARYLDPATDTPVAPLAADSTQTASPRQQVALYMGSELSAEVMQYVAQTCARLKHGLTVLSFQPEASARALLAPYADTLATDDIELRLETLSGDVMGGLARYLRRHPEVAFLACNETGYLGRGLLNGTQRQDGLPVPVVLVAARAGKAEIIGHTLPAESVSRAA